MIISASRRTDIPAFFADWFYNRIEDRYVLVRNPINPRMVSRVELTPEVVDGIVFWTKNPLPMLNRLDMLRDYTYYYQFTLNAYGTDIEPGVPAKNDAGIPTFQRLADMLGPHRVIWRYDPIVFGGKYTAGYHADYFDKLASRLEGYTEKCVISFLDVYRHIGSRLKASGIRPADDMEIETLAPALAESAAQHGLVLQTCAEQIDLSRFGIGHGRCVDGALLESIGGFTLKTARDRGQRPACLCHASVDIGANGTCAHGCIYCYANGGAASVRKNLGRFDMSSPMLCSQVEDGDRVTLCAVKSDRMGQGLLDGQCTVFTEL